jgi:hypothetical protein
MNLVQNQTWNGVFTRWMKQIDGHSTTVRYQTKLETHPFDAYLPRVLLPRIPPEVINIGIVGCASANAALSLRQALWDRDSVQDSTAGKPLVYFKVEELGPSVTYVTNETERAEVLYVTWDVFQGFAPPPVLLVAASAVPSILASWWAGNH